MCCLRIGVFANRRCILLGLAITIALLALNFVTYWQQLSPPPPAPISQVERRMRDRRQRLAAKCHEYGLDQRRNDSRHRPNARQMLINRPHHLIYCNVFKAASTSWLYNFNLLAGYEPALLNASRYQINLARRKYRRVSPAELRRSQNDSLTFLIVRHPFERLISAYRDKIVEPENSFWAQLSRAIILFYRRQNPLRPSTEWPTFVEFVSYLLNENKYSNNLDEHWTPIVWFCTPCQVRFDMIIKFETLDEDQRYLISLANLSHLIVPQWKNRARTPVDHRQLFDQLGSDQIDGLYEMFRYDFELFGYTIAGYSTSRRANVHVFD